MAHNSIIKVLDTLRPNHCLTAADLIAALVTYPPDTPIFNGNGYSLKPSSITEYQCDDWTHSTPYVGEDGAVYETPATMIGISIGPRF